MEQLRELRQRVRQNIYVVDFSLLAQRLLESDVLREKRPKKRQ